VFQDETGFSLHPRLGRGWARRGRRLRVPTRSEHHDRLNLSGWVAPLLGRRGLVRTARGNRDGFLQVLRHMAARLQGYRLCLYVDGASWHKGEEVGLFLESHTEIRLEYLPAYQPALNPQERIWRQMRYEATRNVWFPDLDTLHAKVKQRMRHWSTAKVKHLCTIT